MHARHVFAALLIGLLASGPAQAATITLQAVLNGANEVPGPGDADGSGLATLTIDTIALTVVWEITVADIDPIFAAHIHIGDATVAGEVRVDFSGQLSGGPLFDEDLALVAAVVGERAQRGVSRRRDSWPAVPGRDRARARDGGTAAARPAGRSRDTPSPLSRW